MRGKAVVWAIMAVILLATLAPITGTVISEQTGSQSETIELMDTAQQPQFRLDSLEIAEEKVQPWLLQLAKENPKETVKVYILTRDPNELGAYLRSIGVDTRIGEIPANPGHKILAPSFELTAEQVLDVARLGSTISVVEYTEPTVEMADIPLEELAYYSDDVITPLDYATTLHHGAQEVWNKYGITGSGVNIAIVDTGFDFAHPDLMDTYAVVEDPSSPYYGWPIVYDQASMETYITTGKYGFDNSSVYGAVWPGSFYVNTSTNVTATNGYVEFDGKKYYVGGIPSASGHYHIGYHVDGYLFIMYYLDAYFAGEPLRNVAVLVTDSTNPYEYDTVYVDLDNDGDFTDEKPCNVSSPVSYKDNYDTFTGTWNNDTWNGGDGYADISGGMIYFIADGKTPIPYSDVWTASYGINNTIPSNGDLVAFVGEFFYGYTHGTMCAASALGRGKVLNGYTPGMAIGAKLIPLPFYGNVFDIWYFTQEGYDGDVTTTADQAQITSNSFGWSSIHNDGWHIIDRYADYVIRLYPYFASGYAKLPDNSFTIALGNGGPGYGTVTTPDPQAAIGVAAGIDFSYRQLFGWDDPNIESKYGDVIPFSARGPTANGKVGVDVVATGAYALTAQALNAPSYLAQYFDAMDMGDGYYHLQYGSGTSMATPITAGALALVYEAYYNTYGAFPDIGTAKSIIKSSADDINHDVFTQGSGWLNATAAVEIALGVDGIEVRPGDYNPLLKTSLIWDAGSFEGTRYDMFTSIMFPGETDTMIFDVINHNGSAAKTVSISAQVLEKYGEYRLDTDTPCVNFTVGQELPDTEKDYVWNITDVVPADAELMTAYAYVYYEDFDLKKDYQLDGDMMLEIHDFSDDNPHDGNITIYNETARFTVSSNSGDSVLVTLRNPISRIHDGLLLRLRTFDALRYVKIYIVLEFYKKVDWTWVTLNTTSLNVPAGGSAQFQANLTVPADTPVGTYEGAIYITYGTSSVVMPVVVNVAGYINETLREVQFGGAGSVDKGLYNNSAVRGYFDWTWRAESGDWRFYYVYIDNSTWNISGKNLVGEVNWEQAYSDIDLMLLAPANDVFGDYYSVIYGPYTLDIKGMSEDTYDGSAYHWQTSSGTTKEVQGIVLENRGGLYQVILHEVLYGGEAAYENISGRVYILGVNYTQSVDIVLNETPDNIVTNGTFLVNFTFDYDLTGVDVATYGPAVRNEWYYPAVPVHQDDLSGPDFVTILANAQYSYLLNVSGLSSGGRIFVHIKGDMNAPDLDLGLFYDANGDGVAQPEEFVAYDADSDSDEKVEIWNPQDGTWIIKVLGYSVTEPATFSLYILTELPVEPFQIVSYPAGTINASQQYSIEVYYDLPGVAFTFGGMVYFGPDGNAKMFEVPVTITILDNVPPEVLNVTPVDGSLVSTVGGKVLVSFEVKDLIKSTPDSYTVYVDGINYTANVSYDADAGVYRGAIPLADGIHTMNVTYTDGFGNSDSKTVTFEVDGTPPDLTILSPADGTATNATSVTVQWSVSDAHLDHVEVSLGATSPVDVGTATEYTFENLEDGTYKIYVIAYDAAGNKATSSITLTVDTTLPVVNITSPEDGSYVSTGSVEVTWTCVEDNLDHFEVRVDDGNWINVGTNTSYILNLTDGAHVIYVKAVDTAGNENTTSVTVTVDTVAPVVEITSPEDGGYTTGSAEVTWTCVEDNLDHFEVRVDGGDWINVGTNTSYVLNLADGAHTISVKAVDLAGNAAIYTITVTVDTVAPVVEITSPEDGSYVSTDAVEVTWTCVEDNLDHFEVRVDDGDWINVGTNTSYVLNLEGGEHVIYVKAVDLAGNENTASVKVIAGGVFGFGEGSYLWIALILVIIVVVLAIAFFMKSRKKGPEEEIPGEETAPETEEMESMGTEGTEAEESVAEPEEISETENTETGENL